ncbi:PREDICTED: protein DDI1 homolog 2-like [Priapulus caudatus]|uniref:Protein DDI1 homolog 2-like n=1 Tax=Priapulus caudatus TaxID=37621 RepID=A0ABM1E351_PRICU|nr:PREDICTED: protein DDI1 homolog 2-like [Priapulus caudatus]
MKISITTESDEFYTVDVSADLEVENFKALCELECNIPASEMTIVFEGHVLDDNQKPLAAYGLKDTDVVLVKRQQAGAGNASNAPGFPFNFDFSSIPVPTDHGAQQQAPAASGSSRQEEPSPEQLRQMLLASPHDLALLKENNPRLAEALLSGDLDRFKMVLEEQQKIKRERDLLRIRMMNADPFDMEAQKLIAEEIRLKNVESNMEQAIEHAPESFGQVIMLYIDCRVNGHQVKAFVDSGAQTTIMSQACAERCNIKRLIDTRWAGVAKGVGTQKIIGRVHLGQIQIGKDFLTSSFSILEDQPMDMLLGLDMLRRHQCIIDLKRNLLVIGTTGTETSFLVESELPDCARLNRSDGAATADAAADQEMEDEQLAKALSESSDAAHTPAQPAAADTAAGSAGSPQPPSAADPDAGGSIAETSIQALMGMGFTREQAREELVRQAGDLNKAAGVLFAKSFGKF